MKRILICILCVVLLCGCNGNVNIKSTEKPTVTATIFPLYDFARAIGGDLLDVKLLIKPGAEVHSYDPLPSDMTSVYNSDLFLYIGGESDEWVNTLLNGTDLNLVSLIDCVTCDTEHNHEHKHSHNDTHEHSDEHIWTSPDNAVLMLEKICENIIEIDLKNAEIYRKNCDEYIKKIKSASDEISKTVSKHKDPFILVADRFPYEYFTEQYGIEYEAAFDGCAATTDISFKTMARLVETIKEKNIKTVFCTELSSKNIAKALSEETGVEITELHSAHNVTLDDFNGGITYVDILYRNLDALERGLSS